MRERWLATWLPVVALLAACDKASWEITPDSKDVVANVDKLIVTQVGEKPSRVDCPPKDGPGGMKGKIGSSFVCTAQVDGVAVPVSVRLDGMSGLTVNMWLETQGG